MFQLTGDFSASDQSIYRHLAEEPSSKINAGRIAETYDGYKDLQKEHVVWSKHYFIAGSLLLASQLNLITELNAFGVKFTVGFIPLAALVYVSVSILIFTNFELKMRVYREVYVGEFEGLNAGSRLLTVMRYPLAFHGGAFSVMALIGKTHLMSGKDVILSFPMLIAIKVTSLALVVISILISLNTFIQVARLPGEFSPLKYVVLAAFVASTIFSMTVLRSSNKSHNYHFKTREELMILGEPEDPSAK